MFKQVPKSSRTCKSSKFYIFKEKFQVVVNNESHIFKKIQKFKVLKFYKLTKTFKNFQNLTIFKSIYVYFWNSILLKVKIFKVASHKSQVSKSSKFVRILNFLKQISKFPKTWRKVFLLSNVKIFKIFKQLQQFFLWSKTIVF